MPVSCTQCRPFLGCLVLFSPPSSEGMWLLWSSPMASTLGDGPWVVTSIVLCWKIHLQRERLAFNSMLPHGVLLWAGVSWLPCTVGCLLPAVLQAHPSQPCWCAQQLHSERRPSPAAFARRAEGGSCELCSGADPQCIQQKSLGIRSPWERAEQSSEC